MPSTSTSPAVPALSTATSQMTKKISATTRQIHPRTTQIWLNGGLPSERPSMTSTAPTIAKIIQVNMVSAYDQKAT